jgi:hypothetical protein
MDHTPLAAASIGRVSRARLPNGTPVAVNVQRPGVAEAMSGAARGSRLAGSKPASWSELIDQDYRVGMVSTGNCMAPLAA